MGTIETPIVLTNTLSVGVAYDAVVQRALIQNPDIGRSTGTVNPLICECNDGFLNDSKGPAAWQVLLSYTEKGGTSWL